MKPSLSASKRVFIAALALLPLWAGAQAPANPAAAPPYFVLVLPGSPHASLGSMIASSQRAPDTLRYGTGNPAVTAQANAFMERHQARMVNIPYRGSQSAVNDLFGGVVHAAVVPNQLAQQLIAEGKVRSLGSISADGNTSDSADLPPPPPAPVTGTSG